jgi:hypothetical protein
MITMVGQRMTLLIGVMRKKKTQNIKKGMIERKNYRLLIWLI